MGCGEVGAFLAAEEKAFDELVLERVVHERDQEGAEVRRPPGSHRQMNDLFGAEAFTESQVREFVNGLVLRLLAYPDLVKQTQVNSKKQFLESQAFQSAVTEAVIDNQGAHNTMADYFFSWPGSAPSGP